MKNTEQFIMDAVCVHGDKYDYTLSDYTGAKNKVEIICRVHKKSFMQAATDHLMGRGCPDCGMEQGHQKLKMNKNSFADKAAKIHGSKYNYAKVIYVNNHTPVEVVCDVHEEFMISPTNHLSGRGCPKCAVYGFREDLPASLYILKDGATTKIGITNRAAQTRVKEINKDSSKNFTVLFQDLLGTGMDAKAVEYGMLVGLRADYKSTDEVYNGSTESFIDVDNDYLVKTTKTFCTALKELYGNRPRQ